MSNSAALVRDFVDGALNLQGARTVREGLARLFDVKDSAELLLALSYLVFTIEDAKKLLRADGAINYDLYAQAFDVLEEQLSSADFGSTWEGFRRAMVPLQKDLYFAADYLRRAEDFGDIDAASLQEISRKVDELIADLTASTHLPKELKMYLLAALDEIQRAIRFYRVRGRAGLHDAYLKTVGTLVVCHDDVVAASNDPSNQQFFENLGSLVRTLNASLELARKAAAIPAAIGRLLSFLSQ